MKPDQIYKDRLLSLAAYLESVDPKRFNFGQWVGNDWGGLPDLSCGTTACGLGHATTMPEFQALGLYLMKAEDNGLAAPALKGTDLHWWAATCEATEKIWGLTVRETEFLFTPTCDYGDDTRLDDDIDVKELATHLREWVAGNLERQFSSFLHFIEGDEGDDDDNDEEVDW